jgi:hypothetical protein
VWEEVEALEDHAYLAAHGRGLTWGCSGYRTAVLPPDHQGALERDLPVIDLF